MSNLRLCVCVCVVHGYNERSDLGVGDGQGVHPDAPAAPLVFDGVIEKDAEDSVHHLCDFLLFCVSRVDVAQGEHPLLPHRALQQAPEMKKCSAECESRWRVNTTRTGVWCRSMSCEVVELLPAVLSAVIEQFDHVWQEDPAHLHALGGWRRVLQQSSYHFQNF